MSSNKEQAEKLKELEQERERALMELAKSTIDEMKQWGCILPKDSREPDNYMVIGHSDYAQRTGKLVWSNHFEAALFMWEFVKDKILQMQIPLAYNPFYGFYIGNEGDQCGLVAMSLNNAMTRIHKAANHMAYVIVDGKVIDGGEESFKRMFKHGDIDGMNMLMKRLIKVINTFELPFQPSFDVYLLLTHQDGNEENSIEAD